MPPMPQDAQDLVLDQVPFASAANPVDITAQVMHRPELLGSTARLMLDQGGYGSLLVFLANGVRTDAGWRLQQDLAVTLRREFPDRAVVFSALSTSERTQALDALGCASFEDPSSAMHAIAALSHFAAKRPLVAAAVRSAVSPAVLGALNELEAMQLLGRYGIATPPAALAATAMEAVEAARHLGFPVVMKVLSADIQHKTEIGGVILGVTDEAAVQAAFRLLCERWETHMPGRPFEGVVVASMISGGLECILGLHRDPQFGLVAVFGMGGIQAELLADVTVRRLPLCQAEAREMVSGLKSSIVFSGYRGSAPLDIAALEAAILALSRFGEEFSEALESVDLNPLVIRKAGQGVIALDAVVQWRR
ncbi:ATP-grasp domain protein [Xylophilus ampelinus]|nr:ATP-grasp domain protein [Xylophilus ampelinus]